MSYVIIFLMLIVLGILLVGIVGFAFSPTFSQKNSNRLMRLRVLFQALAIIAIFIFGLLATGGD